MSIKLNGSNSGSVEIDVPADAGLNTAITFPATSGEVIVSNTSGDVDLGPLTIDGAASDGSVNLDSSGRLLVGTSSDITSNANYVIQNVATGGGSIALARNDGTVGAGETLGRITFYGNDGGSYEPAAQIECEADLSHASGDKPGRLVFSTTADGASSPTERMRISNDGSLSSFTTGGSVSIRNTRTAASFSTGLGVYAAATDNTNGTLTCQIQVNGNIRNQNNSYGSLSDIKLKENIVDANSQWDDLKALQVRNYNLKEGQTHSQIGLIAQEVELVSPGLVSESPDRDEEGNDLGTVTKSVNYSVLYMKAVKALQEAMERIETLEASNAALDARLTALEGGAS